MRWLTVLGIVASSFSFCEAFLPVTQLQRTLQSTKTVTVLRYQEEGSSGTNTPVTEPTVQEDTTKNHLLWPTHFITAKGDYTDELYLEQLQLANDNDKERPLYASQELLPRLPVPSLQETLQTLEPTVVPLATSDEELQAFQKALRSFPEQAQVYHERLLEKKRQADATHTSWLQSWWQPLVYLQYRLPLPQHVSYFLLVPDDAKLDTTTDDNTITPGLKRATALVTATVEARQGIVTGRMAAEMAGDAPLCSVGFKYMFHATRIPTPVQDIYHLYDPARYSHIVVATGGQFYAVQVMDQDQMPLPLPLIQARLAHCQALAREQVSYPSVGWITSLDRDTWTGVREAWVKHDALSAALETLESGAFVVALDDEEPTTLNDACTEFWHGGTMSGGNRWFDKSMQLLVTRNGKIAYQGEHSMLDAAPTIPVIRRILKTNYARLAKKYSDQDWAAVTDEQVEGGVRNIFADCWSDPELLTLVQPTVEKARKHHAIESNKFEIEAVQFTDFGKKQAKQWGLEGPLMAQMAIQLAGYRLFGKLVGCYEAASTRGCLHGRTETTRPVSPDTLAFVQAMDNDKVSNDEKLAALQAAYTTIAEYQAKAASGLGVDRHLFGLSCMMEEGEYVPDLFADPLYQRAKTFRLSTSSVIFTPGFGPVEEDGLGVAFNAEKDAFTFIITSRKVNNYAKPFSKLVEQSLQDLGAILALEESDD